MSALRRTLVVATCALAAVVLLETLRWARPITWYAARAPQPYASMDDAGTVRLGLWETTRGADGVARSSWRMYDVDGRPLGAEPVDFQHPERMPWRVGDTLNRESNPWIRVGRLDDRLAARPGPEALLTPLNAAQGWGYDPAWGRWGAEFFEGRPKGERLAWWTFEDGRYLCRDLRDGEVLAGFGPDGFARGATGAAGAKFPTDVDPAPGMAWWGGAGDRTIGVLLDAAGRRVHFVLRPTSPTPPQVVVPGRPSPSTTSGPLAIEVATFAVGDASSAPPVAAADRSTAWLWRSGNEREARVPLRVGRELLVVGLQGVERRVTLDAEERELVPTGNAASLATVLPPVGAPVARMRLRRFKADGTTTTVDVETIPVTTGGRVAVFFAGLPSLARPPILDAVSFAGPRVADYDDFFSRFFADGVVAGGDGGAWLAGALLVAAACGLVANRQAKLRAPDRVLLWTALGAAFGVLGLAWMRIALPKSHVAACACGRRRAAHVAACPSCAARWPAPRTTGVEVFA